MQRIKNTIISVISFVIGIYFFYVGIDMIRKYGFSIFEDGGGSWGTGHKRFERLGEFICGFMVAIGGCVSGCIHAYLAYKNKNNVSEIE